jgi:hypothetical protein
MANCLVGYFTGLLDEKVIKVMPATKVLFLAVAFLVHDGIYALAAGFPADAFWDALIRRTAPSGIYTLLIGAMVFYFLVAPSRPEH